MERQERDRRLFRGIRLAVIFVLFVYGHQVGASPPLGPTLVTEQAGVRKVNNSKILNFVSGCTVTASGTTANVTCSGGSGTVTSIACGTGLSCSPSPITGAGTVSLSTPVSIANGGTNSSSALNNNRLMYSTGGAISEFTALTNGQLAIGSTGASPVAASLTAGTGISITPGAGSISIASTTGGETLQGTYNAGGAGPQVIQEDSTRLGIQIRDTVAGLGVDLFAVTDSAGTVKKFRADASGIFTSEDATVTKVFTVNGNTQLGNNTGVDTVTATAAVTCQGNTTLGNDSADVTKLVGTFNVTNVLMSSTAPTISSGFGTTPSISANNGTAAFRVNVGTGGTASSGVIGLPTATTGWNCYCTDLTTQSSTVFLCKQTASSTTSATVGNFDAAGAAAAWAASDILAVSCFAL